MRSSLYSLHSTMKYHFMSSPNFYVEVHIALERKGEPVERQPGVLNIGVVGLGQGRSHLAAFQSLEGSRVLAVADLNAGLRERTVADYAIERQYTSIEELLSDRDIDVVVVATPDHLHGQHAIAALEAEKHVLSEIPMATTFEECRRIIELTDRSGLKYHMGNQVRYAHCLQDVHGLIRTGDLGEIFYGEGEYLHNLEELIARKEPNHWRVDPTRPQTTLLGGGPHALDTLRWLMGARFTHVSAFHAGHTTEWGNATHTTVAIYKAANGATAKVTTAYGMIRPYCLYYSVYGSKGSFERTRLQGESGGETTNYLYHSRLSGTDHMIPVTLPNFNSPAISRQIGQVGHGTMEYEQARDFLASIVNDTEPAIGPREAAASIVPLIFGLKAADAGGGLVEIPSIG
jgi:predicted dehydrogenase